MTTASPDQPTILMISKLCPQLQPMARAFVHNVRLVTGREIRLTRGLCTFEEQNDLYAFGRTKIGKIVTFAKAGRSMHNYGLAFDFCFVGKNPYLEDLAEAKKWPEFEAIWEACAVEGEKLGLVSGRRFTRPRRDNPHMELQCGLTIDQIASIHVQYGVKRVWQEYEKKLYNFLKEKQNGLEKALVV